MKHIKFEIAEGQRAIVLSDIHGHFNVLEKMIKRLELKEADYLIVVGDFISKGPDSYKTFKMIQDLSQRENTIILKGNHEMYYDYLLRDAKHLVLNKQLLWEESYETLIHAAIRSHSKTLEDFSSESQVVDYMHEHFKETMDFIDQLPIIAETEDFIFVHGGYEEHFSLEEDEVKYLKYDDYYSKSKGNDKKVIVGHWPACILRNDRIDNSPYFYDEKNIVFIDGGLGVKDSGELNALIIEKQGGQVSFSFIQEDSFAYRKVVGENIFEKEDTVYVNYPHYEIEAIHKGDTMTKCLHVHTQKEFSIFNSLLRYDDQGKAHVICSYINEFVNPSLHDRVKICKAYDDVSLVKYEDKIGWIYNRQLGD